MKHRFYILTLCSLLLVLGSALRAQDVQRFSERQIIGTARYVGMGGAMTAIGGDPSAALDNPAGLGLYRRSEITLTIDETIDNTTQLLNNSTQPLNNSTQPLNHPTQRYTRSRFAAPQVSAIWSWGNPAKQRGLIYNNLMFSINRLANYNRDVVVNGRNTGMVETICLKTNGLPEMDLVPDETTQYDPWNNEDIGWLSILGYETYLIDPADNNQWQPAISLTDGSLSVAESGNSDQYALSWAGNISNQWYVGVALNIPTISYTKNISLVETNRLNSAELRSMFHVSGVGVSGSFGIIYRPLRALRLGASFQTPTVMSLSMQTEGDMYTTIAGEDYKRLTPASGVHTMKMSSPLRTSVSVAGQLGNIGLLALQYDYAHAMRDKEGFMQMDDVHTLRIGAEAQVIRGLFLNAGYVYESSFIKEEQPVGLDYYSIRTDIDYRYTQSTQYASVGFGYRGDAIVAQFAYQYRWQTLHQYASECQLLPMEVGTHTHRLVAALAWRF